MTYKYFFYYHIHHGLTQEKFGSEEGRLARFAPLSTIEATIHTENNFTFVHEESCFVTPYTICLVPRTPVRCSISYRFRGSPSLLTPHLLPISNCAGASLFWKSTGSNRFPNTLLLRLAPFPLVLGCSRSLVGVGIESSEVVQKTAYPLLFLAPHAAPAPHHFSEHHALRLSRILHACHISREQDPPPA